MRLRQIDPLGPAMSAARWCVLDLNQHGLTPKEIGASLGICAETVRSHLRASGVAINKPADLGARSHEAAARDFAMYAAMPQWKLKFLLREWQREKRTEA